MADFIFDFPTRAGVEMICKRFRIVTGNWHRDGKVMQQAKKKIAEVIPIWRRYGE
jgi:hypothetical protein